MLLLRDLRRWWELDERVAVVLPGLQLGDEPHEVLLRRGRVALGRGLH